MEVGTEGWLDLLRSDLGWWFEHSRGWTQTVLLLLVDSTQQSVYLEQWYLGNRPKPLLVSRKTIRCTQTDGPDLFFETVKLMDLTPPELPWFFVEWKDQLASVKRGFLLE
ncbi:uncharacterized protein BO80DRAFT_429563 [Aspergillus ibericus CBS 121593]|uniref:Uncharacterized protein n=1 Tax=Aspergillus ibericus CBS 121593 TaxID=1448316 RepID=A0A395GK37_9EURO|nr:hypothetical protein BO80DRAFT_429563 [Aspergillus ibericus CBS 121593]RAK95829.1 hypothetical protein BO80DRAFT_429563 [Aspergillus ibericus CBS 121593]